jgi:putative addiction module CopG family antidote
LPTRVALDPHLEAFVRELLDAGQYNSVSEVVHNGLCLLEQRQQEAAAKLDALHVAVAVGVADIDEGRFTVIDVGHIAATVADLGESAMKRSARRRARRP